MAFDGLLGPGSAARQLLIYGVGYEIARSLLGPMFTQIEYEINTNSQLVELSPPELADLVVRGVIANEPDAAARATKFGLDASRFEEMVRLAGEPPGLVQVLEWWRRGFLPWDQGIGAPSVAEAIRTSRIYTYWTDTIRQAQFVPPSAADAVDAVLRNQVTLEQGIALAYFAGLGVGQLQVPAGADTSDTSTAFQVLLDTAGRPPSVGELLELAKRGIIPWGDLDPNTKQPNPAELSFAQGVYEGDTKDKWLPAYAALAEYLPPPRTITALLRSGAISTAQALDLFTKAGLSTELAQAYIASAHSTKSVAQKQLSLSAVLQMYEAKLLDAPTATQDIVNLGYTAAEAAAELAFADYQRAHKGLTAATNRVGSAYIAKRIDAQQATTALAALGVPADAVTQYIQEWDIERTTQVKVLTEGQVVSAFYYQVFSDVPATNQATAQGLLVDLGYSPYQAWVLLSARAHGPLPNMPPP